MIGSRKWSVLLLVGFAHLACAEEFLGKARLYHTASDDMMAELVLVPLGNPGQRHILAHFNVPGFSVDGEYNVYAGECETTDCKTVFYRVIGGKNIGFVFRDSDRYYGSRMELPLAERKDPLSVYFDEKSSGGINSAEVYQAYLNWAGRDRSGTYNASAVSAALDTGLKALNASCKTTAQLQSNAQDFQKGNAIHLLGMGAKYLEEVAARCSDPDYLQVLNGIKTIKLIPGTKHQPAILDKGTLILPLSEDIYNPRYEARTWLDAL